MHFLLPLLLVTTLHPVHETLTEVEWNAGTKRLEVAVRLDALDEQWIGEQFKKDKRIDRTKHAAWAIAYAKKTFFVGGDELKDGNPPKVKLRAANTSEKTSDQESPKQKASEPKPTAPEFQWIGRQTDGAHVWWYFEIAPPGGERPTWIQQRMLYERNAGYTSRVVILGDAPTRSLTLTIQSPAGRLDALNEQQKPDR